jgi:hypothetical protein
MRDENFGFFALEHRFRVLGVWGAMEPKTNVSPTNAFRCLLPRRPSRQNSCACRPPG